MKHFGGILFLCLASAAISAGAETKSDKSMDRGPATAGGATCQITGAGIEVAKILQQCEAGSSHSVTPMESQNDGRAFYARTVLVCCLKGK